MLNTIGDDFFNKNPQKILGVMSEGFRGRIIVDSSNEFIKSYFDALFNNQPLPVYDKLGVELPVLNSSKQVKAPSPAVKDFNTSVTKLVAPKEDIDLETSDLISILQSLEPSAENEELLFILKNLK